MIALTYIANQIIAIQTEILTYIAIQIIEIQIEIDRNQNTLKLSELYSIANLS